MRGDWLNPYERLLQAEAFVGNEKESMVAPERTAQAAGKIVEAQGRARVARAVGKPIVGVQRFVAEAVKQRSMKFVRAGAAGDARSALRAFFRTAEWR